MIKMKKTFIYTLCILLGSGCFFSSCEDMLSVDSERVIYDFDKLTLGDSVYSVLGILKSVQNVADRQVLLGELRGDLVSVNPGKAVLEIQELSNFTYGLDNKYLSAKDYYSIINNCNLFLERVDTTLERDNRRLMLPEYVAVKSVRAWTYMQLAINYGAVPYFTHPILTHSQAAKVMQQPRLTIREIAPLLIEDIAHFENPRVYSMPKWAGINSGDGIAINTKSLFVPIRFLLGELNMWLGNYAQAAKYYYDMIDDAKYVDYSNQIMIRNKNGREVDDNYSVLFESKSVNSNSNLAVIPMETTTAKGTVSELAEIFAPINVGANQLVASQGHIGLSERQTNVYRELAGDGGTDYTLYYNPGTLYKGDLRLLATTTQQKDYAADAVYSNIISKHNMSLHNITPENGPMSGLNTHTTFVRLYRSEHLYMRLAEAVLGMARNGAEGAVEFIMDVLKDGVYGNYTILSNVSYSEVPQVDDEGNPVLDEDGNQIIEIVKNGDPFVLDFTDVEFEKNKGIHSRGSGDCEYNEYYSLTDTCIARSLDILVPYENTDSLVITRDLTAQDTLNYVTDLVVDELALEFAFEGHRFTDLIRLAEATGETDILAKRVAGRDFKNTVGYRAEGEKEYECDDRLYSILSNKTNWYLPLPDSGYVPLGIEDDKADDTDETPSEEVVETPSEDVPAE